MILLIDIGNSRTKYVQLVSSELSAISQLTNNEFTEQYFARHFSKARQVIVANVAKSELTHRLATWCTKQNIYCKQVHSEQQKNTLISAYQKPTTLGIDRWLALLGTLQLYPQQNVLIIDAGTATTVDLLASSGQHQGGWILAGINALFNSILSHSTLVHAKSTTAPSLAFGNNTTDNVNNACWAATLGMIQQAIIQAQQLSRIDHIILTGGDGQTLTTLLLKQAAMTEKNSKVKSIQFIDKLIFYGLKEYAAK